MFQAMFGRYGGRDVGSMYAYNGMMGGGPVFLDQAGIWEFHIFSFSQLWENLLP